MGCNPESISTVHVEREALCNDCGMPLGTHYRGNLLGEWRCIPCSDRRATIATLTTRAERAEAELARLRADNAGLRADNHLLARAWRGISPDRNTQTEAEADATEEAIERAARAALSSEQAAAGVDDSASEDDGCPHGDPDCLGNNGDCHDACSTFAERAAAAGERG